MAELITVSCGNVSTTIDSMGAQMMSLKLGDAEYLWQGDERWWPRRSPVLFPIVGNIRNDVATSAQGEIHFGRHGIARTRLAPPSRMTSSSASPTPQARRA